MVSVHAKQDNYNIVESMRLMKSLVNVFSKIKFFERNPKQCHYVSMFVAYIDL